MLRTLKNAFTTPEIRKKMILTFLIILVYRIGCYIPIPGLDIGLVQDAASESSGFLSMMYSITGGSLSNGTLFALEIGRAHV